MMPTGDTVLLQEYAHTGAESAFAEVVERHVGLVYNSGWHYYGPAKVAR
jgi:hypothetical protein